jgi:phosphopantetheinyl transferase
MYSAWMVIFLLSNYVYKPADMFCSFIMDPNIKQLQEALVDIETDAEQLLLARHQVWICFWLALIMLEVSKSICFDWSHEWSDSGDR